MLSHSKVTNGASTVCILLTNCFSNRFETKLLRLNAADPTKTKDKIMLREASLNVAVEIRKRKS